MDIYELIKLRKSVRSYLPKAIEDDKLNRILDAGRLAPSASNSQEWRFIIVKNEESRRLLAASTNKHDFIAEAPAIIVCCAETDQRIMRCGISAFTVDVSIVIDHITLAATEEGLGTCWIGGFDAEQVKQVLGIPEGIVVVELLPIGYPRDPSLMQKNRLPLESLVHHETW